MQGAMFGSIYRSPNSDGYLSIGTSLAQHLGRSLTDDEQVHHVNGVKGDNRIENLRALTASQHRLAEAVRHEACEGCGAPFFAQRSALYCGTGCKQRAWRIRSGHTDTRKRAPEDPVKKRARNILHGAIRRGRVTRQPCEVCGDESSQAHHLDYNEPLNVRWLCRTHHELAHGRVARPRVAA